MSKIKIHVRNNHWKAGSLPCDLEGEKHSTITKEEFEKGLSQHPEIKDKIEYLVDWDDDNYLSSMKDSRCFVRLASFQLKTLENYRTKT